jgi:hypothetical protein
MFRQQLASNLLSSAEDCLLHKHTEEDLRQDLHASLQAVCRSVGISNSQIRMEGTNTSGRFDSLYGHVLIEWKRPGRISSSRIERNQAACQALSYVDDQRFRDCSVIVTDGLTWGFYRPSILLGNTQLMLDLDGVSSPTPVAEERFSWRKLSAESMLFVISIFESFRFIPPTSGNIQSSLGTNRRETLNLVEALISQIMTAGELTRAGTLFKQWKLTAGVAYGLQEDDDVSASHSDLRNGLIAILPNSVSAGASTAHILFGLQTYVALVSKLIVVEIVALRNSKSSCRPSEYTHADDDDLSSFLRGLESGDLSQELRIPGCVEGNVFDWYAYLDSTTLLSMVRSVLQEFASISWVTVSNTVGITVDILRDLYHSVVPPVLRKHLGEFFTPTWLAEYTYLRAAKEWSLKSSKDIAQATVLDPTCGSGTFLLIAISDKLRRLASVREVNAADINVILSSVRGIDINPISCLMARINILLGLGDALRLSTSPELFVYEADSLLKPSVRLGEIQPELFNASGTTADTSVDVVEIYTALEEPFMLPSAYLHNPECIASLRRGLVRLLACSEIIEKSEVSNLLVRPIVDRESSCLSGIEDCVYSS